MSFPANELECISKVFKINLFQVHLFIYFFRKLLLETQLADMWWEIDWADIELLDINHLGSSLSFARSTLSQNRSTPTVTIR